MRPGFTTALLLVPLLTAAQTRPEAVHAFAPLVVTGRRPAAADAETQDVIRTYDQSEIETSGAFDAQEFLDNLPRGGGQGQLVLIDGMPADLDLATLSPAMIAKIEVSYSGAMPAYGAYARGRVVNISLKQDYNERELSLQGSGSLHGDAWRREAMVYGGSAHAPWRVIYSARYSRNDAVTADERDFSREQDRRAAGGKDYRLPWGYPAVVQAVAGNLTGVFDAAGQPVAVALVPEGAAGPLAPGDFLAGTGPAGAGQRHYNTAPYLYLASPAENLSGSLRLTRKFGQHLELNWGATYRTSRSRTQLPPPVSAAAPETLVPAALNPFGQDVLVGLVHTGFGPVVQRAESDNLGFNLSGRWTGPAWRADGNLTHAHGQSNRDTRDLDPAALTAALASPEAASRFNPFTDAVGANAALYPALALHRLSDTSNNSTQFSLRAYGPVGSGWGAGPARLAFGASGGWREDERTFRNLRGVADATTLDHTGTYSIDGNANLPLRKGVPHFYLLDGWLNGAYSFSEAGGSTLRRGAGLRWSPVKPWVFSLNYRVRTSTPGEQDNDDLQAEIATLLDPRRTPATAENVQVISRRTGSARSSRGEEAQFALSFQPPARPGLSFNVDYSLSHQTQATGSPFSPQDVLDNETLFVGRVVRDTPTAADLALGQPGRILAVDTTPATVAAEEHSELDCGVEYALPERPAGRFQFGAGMEWVLGSRYEVAAGQQFVSREEGPANLPDWNGRARVQWQRQQWSAMAAVRYTSASRQGTIPAYASVSMNVAYRFTKPVWGKFGKGLQLRFGAQNLGADRPPYADTLLGYRGGSPVGTTVSLSARMPF